MKHKPLLPNVNGLPSYVYFILSSKVTLFFSFSLSLLQTILYTYLLMFSLSTHFDRIKRIQKNCLFNWTGLDTSLPVCFLIDIFPGLVIIPTLSGLLFWPCLLTFTAIQSFIRNKKWDYFPPKSGLYCQSGLMNNG